MSSTKIKTASPPAPDSPPKQSKFRSKVILTVFLGLLAIAIAAFSHIEYDLIKDSLFFTQAKIKKFQSQMELLTALSYQFSLFTLANMCLMFLLTSILNFAYDHSMVMALRRNISNSLEQFIIFIGLFGYLLTKGGCTFQVISVGVGKSELILIANWFLVSRYLYSLGSLAQAKTGYNLRELGVVLNAIALIVPILVIFGFNIFELI